MTQPCRALALLWLGTLCAGCGRLRFEDLRDASSERDAGQSQDAGLDAAQRDAEPSDGERDAEADAASTDADPPDGGDCPPGLAGADCTTCVRYVDVASTASAADGLSWASAYPEIIPAVGAALAVQDASPDSLQCQVWVREGRYYVWYNSQVNSIPLPANVPLYGGFAGSERDLSQRVIAAHASILDGRDPVSGQHVFHPVYVSAGGMLDGFTITGGVANSGAVQHANGGGMTVTGGTMVLRNVTFQDNQTTGRGGALYAQNAELIIENCRFLGNRADGNGGAIHVEPVGTGMSAALTVRSSELRGNTAGGSGGGLAATGAVTLALENLLVAENTAGGGGGGAFIAAAQGNLVASTFSANTAGSSAAGLMISCAPACSVRNSIFWDPSVLPELQVASAAVMLRHDLVRGGATGTAILDSAPQFVAPPADLRLSAGSPAIDSADGCAGPERDFEGLARRDDPAVANTGVGPVFADRGAHEFQAGPNYAPFSALCP